ncbi:MAG: cell wall-associated NlpC family hydrolase [Chthoniobacteraceae bacterium]|nr:cell wall-associated NlpC family hydrolase [Chthoniobacteraceae bacterium]
MPPAPFRNPVFLRLLIAILFAATASAQETSERPKKKKRTTSETTESKPSKKAADEEDAPPKKKPAASEGDAEPSKKKPATAEEPAATPKPRKKATVASAEPEKEPVKKKQVEESNADADEADAASAKLHKKPASAPALETPSKEAKSAAGKAASAPNASVEPDQIVEYAGLSGSIRTLIDAALALTKQNLTYTYGSADPANGGMDCSGTIYYLLRQAGFKDVPRDASGLYSWARKEGKFFAVISKKADGFEFSDIKPGDLLFWNGTYSIDRDPPVTHVMIYLGTEKGRNKRIMAGASDGRTYDGKSRWGVSVFDFVMPRPRPGETMAKADFLGYARIPVQGVEKAAEPEPATAAEPKDEEKPAASSASKGHSQRPKAKRSVKSSD